jgi:FKBP-type peptidyl-prolyl cis-trans isomerase FkpA
MQFVTHLRAAALAVLAIASVPAVGAIAQLLTTTPSGLGIADVEVGTGKEALPGKTAHVHYTGWLYARNTKGRQVDTSRGGDPFSFPVGSGRVIAGWDEGVVGMKVGGRRTLLIPPELGYGAEGAGEDIPSHAALIFDVELMDVRD